MADLPEPYASLARRLGREKLERRLFTQASHWARLAHQGSGLFRLENYLPLDAVVAFALTATGLFSRARANHLDPRLVERTWRLPRLPASFAGFRLLHLTDLHMDLDSAFADALIARLAGVSCDAIVVTGDFRSSTREDFFPALVATRRLLAALPAVPRYGILGNHDFIEQLPHLEADGLPMLLNESAFIERDGQRLWFAGIDDPHFYKTHDLAAATAAIPADACTVLLAHSPEIADELPENRFDLVLCGHTHGGQLCLPGGRWLHVPIKNQPRERIRGAWKAAGAEGYTSVGTGSCGVPARLNCPGEFTLHTLQPA
jgi:predicted MPP superfamily phosphohydrolase